MEGLPGPGAVATIARMTLTLAAAAALGGCGGADPTPAPADLIVHGGTIHSLDGATPSPSVLVVRAGRVAAIGGDELLARHDGPRLDLRGRTLLPGLIDAHAHFLGLGRSRERLDLRGARSYDEVLDAVRARVAELDAGEFLLGRGWNQELWPDERFPTHERLSALTPRNPVLLRRVDGHATLANARAMAQAGITSDTRDPEGGEILRDAQGVPTGVFVDAAAALLPSPPAPSDALRERWALRAQEACFRVGLTGVHDAGVDEATLSLYERLMGEGRLRIRINAMLADAFGEDGEPAPWLARRLAAGPVSAAHDGRLSIRAVKLYADGALGSRGAALLAPYADRPGTTGLLQLSRDELRVRVAACRRAGFQAATHAIGDAANRLALDVYEEVLGEAVAADHRFRIEHAQVVTLEDLPRLAELGVIASVQPTHATSDMNMAEERIGSDRLRGAYAWRRLVESGARLALGSDFPVEHENPLWGLYSATTRQDHDGRPAGGWRAEEALTPEEALRGFTLDAAFAGFDETELGSLAAGKRADFIIVSVDPLSAPPRALVDLAVDETWIDGQRVFARSE